jgi:hypothetical protein
MQNELLQNDPRRRAAEASPLEFVEVTFEDGASPQFDECHNNARRWILENRHCKCVRGWIVSSGVVFDKHSAVQDRGLIYDIAPFRTSKTPFHMWETTRNCADL